MILPELRILSTTRIERHRTEYPGLGESAAFSVTTLRIYGENDDEAVCEICLFGPPEGVPIADMPTTILERVPS